MRENNRKISINDGLHSRLAALQVLKEVNKDGKYANISLKENLRKWQLTGRDAAFVTQLVYGTLEKQISIDYFLLKFANMKRVNPWIENILRMGAYQILFLESVPDFAACNEAVKLCEARGLGALKGFVNGTLRNLSKNKETFLQPENQLTEAENLSLLYSYPLWLVEQWIKDYGLTVTEEILRTVDTGNYTTIRVNNLNMSKDLLKKELEQCVNDVQNGLYMDEALRIKHAGDIEDQLHYHNGSFTVQGESSMLVSHIVEPYPGEMILDACSSPGGKTTHMAELMRGRGKIIAWDVHPHRVNLVKQNCKRMGAEIVEASIYDASVLNIDLINRFDRVLIDAPCSGLGIIHKKPDIKLKITKKSLQELPELQNKILNACSNYVKPGGVLVYSTCTINLAENENIINTFLKFHNEFYLDDVMPFIPDALHSAVQDKFIKIIPSRYGIDGFFIARMRRKKSLDY